MSQKHLLVVGAGPGGYAAAFLAADSGMRVTLVDDEKNPGGVCLHHGCIPSKTLLHLAKLIRETRDAKSWGLDFGEPRIDLSALRNWRDNVTGSMGKGLDMLSRQRKISRMQGRARFINSNCVEVGDQTVDFDVAILASGSRPIIPHDWVALNGNLLMDSTSALRLDAIPKKLLIVGGGYIGLEMGTVYSALGSGVALVEMTEGILPGVDRDLARPVLSRIKNDFQGVYTNTKVASISKVGDELEVVFEGAVEASTQKFDRVLVAVGRKPNSEDLGLENTQVETDERGFVKVDDRQKTADPSILAIGDLTGGAMLAHKASHEARSAIQGLLGKPADRSRTVPAVVFTDPEVAWCGMSETEAGATGRKIVAVKFPWSASGRAATLGRTDGLTKLVLDPESDKILGVGIVGTGAGELIAQGVLAVDQGLTAKDLADSIAPHPTLSETLMEAAQAHLKTNPHIYKRR